MTCLRILLALPLAANLWSATVGVTDRFIPLAQDGGGWSTRVVVTNLAPKAVTAMVTFLNSQGMNETWRVGLKSSTGSARENYAEAALAPGATMIVETAGAAETMTRGFVEIMDIGEQPVGAYAVLTERKDGRVVQSITVPLSPAHEQRSVMPLDLTDTQQTPHLVFVSYTTGADLDLVFRNLAGQQVRRERLLFDGRAQISVNVRERWPELKDFQGTVQWTVSFNGADRYESRFLAGICLLTRDDRPAWSVLSGMTLPADQASTSPY